MKYGKLMRTHVAVLVSMAQKMGDVLEDRQTITPTMMNEFSYPLARARDFVRIVGGRYSARRSLHTFTTFLDVYAALLEEAERVRVRNAEVGELRQQIETLREHGATVIAALTEEGR